MSIFISPAKTVVLQVINFIQYSFQISYEVRYHPVRVPIDPADVVR